MAIHSSNCLNFGTLYIKTEKKVSSQSAGHNYVSGYTAYDVTKTPTGDYTAKDSFLGKALLDFVKNNKKLLNKIGIDDTLNISFKIPEKNIFNLSENTDHKEGYLQLLKAKRKDIYGKIFPIMSTWNLKHVGPNDPEPDYNKFLKERRESQVRKPNNDETMVDVILFEPIKGRRRVKVVRNVLTHTVEAKIAEELKKVMLHNSDFSLTSIEHQPTYQPDWRSWVKAHLGI